MKIMRFRAVALALGLTVVAALYWLAPPARGQSRHQVWVGDVEHMARLAAEDAGQEPALRVLESLTGRGSEIGVSIRDLDDADLKAGKSGVRIDDVRADSPAEQAGIKQGDVVLSFDGERVRSARQFARLVQETPSGRAVKAQVQRDGRAVDLTVTPGSGRRADAIQHERMRVPAPGAPAFRFEPGDMAEMFSAPGREFRFEMFDRPSRLGVGVQGLTPDLADYFGAKDGGVLITSIERDSPASKAGLKAGDVITSVDGAAVDDTGELRRRLWKDEEATEVALGIVRDKKALTVKVPVESQKAPAAPKTGRSKA